MRARTSLLCAAVALSFASPSAAQVQVAISEVNLTPQNPQDDQWIELLNMTAGPVDISSWSLYYATRTPGQPGNYWFALPAGTVLEPAAFVRVHWFAPVPATAPPAGEIYTGNTVFHFLFGYRPEPLLVAGGALALYSTQSNQQMNNPAFLRDWVSWGATGFPRENLAVQASLWIQGDFVSAPIAADSIDLTYDLSVEPTPSSAFFHDASNTPNAHNHPGAAATEYGTPCTFGSLQAPTLHARSVPTAGNRDFGFRIDQTSGAATSFLLFGTGRASLKPPLPGPCLVLVGVPISPLLIPFAQGTTQLRLPLLRVPGGASTFVQTFSLFDPTNHALSNGLQLDLGT